MAVEHTGAAFLDRSGESPLYAQIARLLGDDIRARRLAPGAALPSEAALCRRFGVARSVVRQALSVLLADGLIHREPGRPAIVAAPAEHRRLVQRSTGLYDQFAAAGTLLRTRVLRLESATPPPEVAAFLATEDAWLLERLRRIDDAPLAFVRTWLSRERVAGLRAAVLEDASLHQVLREHYGIRPGRGRNRIRAVGADDALAEMLELARGSPLLMLEGQGMDTEGRPMEWFTTWHRADQLVFDVEVGPEAEQVQVAMPTHGRDAEAAPAVPADDDPLGEVEQLIGAALHTLKRARNRG